MSQLQEYQEYLIRCYGHATSSLNAAVSWRDSTTKNVLLSKIYEADLLLAHRKGSWTFEVLSALRDMPGADVHISAIMSQNQHE